MEELQTKQCKDCEKIKPLDEFYFQEKYSKKKGDYVYYNPKCKDCVKNKVGDHQKANREEINEKRRDYFKGYFKNPERKSKHRGVLRKRNKDGKLREWQKENPDRMQEYAEKRQHKEHEISNEEWESCKNYFNYRCAYCGLAIEDHFIFYKGKLINGDFHRDHVDDEGANDLSNCVPSCKSCNSSKHDSDFNEWYNNDNEIFTQERLYKIHNWLNQDYKLFKR